MNIFAAINPNEETFASLNRSTREWEMRAARGECGWICADCSCSFPSGMPDECMHGQQFCTDIIKRDKIMAQEEIK